MVQSASGTAAWEVLIVDDEPDIHQVTDLALKRHTVSGRPMRLHHAKSAAEARRVLEGNANIAMVLVDGFMETEDAGLELCKAIRGPLVRRTVQLILMTGQVEGPPRAVMASLNIARHLSKPDASVDVLKKIVTEAVERYASGEP